MGWQTCLKGKGAANLKDNSLAAVNKKIYELKKKIQLSEGQRKAQFEECCTEKTKNTDQMKHLNTEIRQLRERLKRPADRSATIVQTLAKHPEDAAILKSMKIPEAVELVDYKVFNQKKHLARMEYAQKRHEATLKKLTDMRNELLEEVALKFLRDKEKEAGETICSLENKIHVVELNVLEGDHINKRYREIRNTLVEDAVHFERTMEEMEAEACRQLEETTSLKAVHREAVGLREKTKGVLVRQEESAVNRGRLRERQLAEHRGLVEECKLELERLERHIFPTGRPVIHQDSESESEMKQSAEENFNNQKLERLEKMFAVLKEATGVTEMEEVLERFVNQHTTKARLSYLKSIAEEDKHDLEKQHECLLADLETFKFSEVKDKEQNVEENEKVKQAVLQQTQLRDSYHTEADKMAGQIREITAVLNAFVRKLQRRKDSETPAITPDLDIFKVMEILKERLGEISEEQILDDEEVELLVPVSEDVWLLARGGPEAAGGEVGRGQQQPPLPTLLGSEEEEDVPTRSYLKRQAQILVDARSRRKQFHAVPRGRRGAFK